MTAGVEDLSRFDHQDAYLDMVSRRLVNEEFAEQPVDFNEEGFEKAKKLVSLSRNDAIVDIGTSSGVFALDAAEAAGITSHLIGIEPDVAAAMFMPGNRDIGQFTFIEGHGEAIPLPDNAAKIVTAHNVLFRAKDKLKMLAEMKRVAEPGGLIIVSTNAKGHAYERHNFEQAIARILSLKLGMEITPPPIPAAGCYLGELPEILKQSGGLQPLEFVRQTCRAIITKDRVGAYLRPLEMAANRTNLPADAETRYLWRQTVHTYIEPKVQRVIDAAEFLTDLEDNDIEDNPEAAQTQEPYFPDIIDRGMIIARNLKPA